MRYSIVCGIISLCVLLSAFVLAIGNPYIFNTIMKPTETIIITEQTKFIEPVIIDNIIVNNITTYTRELINIDSLNEAIN